VQFLETTLLKVADHFQQSFPNFLEEKMQTVDAAFKASDVLAIQSTSSKKDLPTFYQFAVDAAHNAALKIPHFFESNLDVNIKAISISFDKVLKLDSDFCIGNTLKIWSTYSQLDFLIQNRNMTVPEFKKKFVDHLISKYQFSSACRMINVMLQKKFESDINITIEKLKYFWFQIFEFFSNSQTQNFISLYFFKNKYLNIDNADDILSELVLKNTFDSADSQSFKPPSKSPAKSSSVPSESSGDGASGSVSTGAGASGSVSTGAGSSSSSSSSASSSSSSSSSEHSLPQASTMEDFASYCLKQGVEVEIHCDCFQAEWQGFHQVLIVFPGTPRSANDSDNSERIKQAMLPFATVLWPNLKKAFDSESSISTSVIAFKNLVILIYTFTKKPSGEVDDGFLESEDQAFSISVSNELRKKQVRCKSSPSINVDNIAIFPSSHASDTELQIGSKCFKIQLSISEHDNRSKNTPDFDNVITCYQNAFFKFLVKIIPGTDARVRSYRNCIYFSAFKDISKVKE
jgi:hypothetical protein